MTLNIKIITKPHENQRYDTIGDYWTDENGKDHIVVSDMGDWRYEFIIAVHELVEFFICKYKEIPEENIIAHDLKSLSDDPGFDSNAPYREQHHFATGIEMLVAKELGIDWNEYCKAIDRL